MSLKKFGLKAISVALVVFMLMSICAPAIMAATSGEDTPVYVSLGASNVNGYGMRGYIPGDDIMEQIAVNPALKNQVNVYGCASETPDSYPVLIAEALGADLIQLAMSSMRAEEVRFLLDDSYNGDSYTDWRFYDVNGDGNSQNWFIGAGKLVAGDATLSDEEAVEALREFYKESIEDADYITVDIGVNNFGVYVSGKLSDPNSKWENDLALIDPEIAADFEEGKAYVKELIATYVPDFDTLLETMPLDAEDFINTMAYALVGFCVNFDKVMEKIYELNPDATVVTVSIQNLMADLGMSIPGVDTVIPFGDLFGALVNAANIYTAVGSPYANRYNYADVRQNGHVEFFSDELIAWNGDARELSQNMLDCFDVYDNDIYLTYMLRDFINEQWVGLVGSEIASVFTTFESFMEAGATGFAILEGTPYAGYISMLSGKYVEFSAIYENMYYAAHDVVNSIMQAGAKVNVLDIGGLAFQRPLENALLAAIETYLVEAVVTAMEDPFYNFELSDTFFADVAAFANSQLGAEVITEAHVATVAAFAVRTSVGNSFFGHPSPAGHETIARAILSTLANGVTGEDVIANELSAVMKKVLTYLAENHEEILTEAYAYVYNYAEENGYIEMAEEAIDAMIAEFEETLALLKEVVTTQSPEAKAELEAKIEVYIAVLGELKAAAEVGVAEFISALDALKTTLEEDYPELYALLIEWQTELMETILNEYEIIVAELKVVAEEMAAQAKPVFDAAIADIEAKVAMLKDAAKEGAKAFFALLDDVKAELAAKFAEVQAMVVECYENLMAYTVEAYEAIVAQLNEVCDALPEEVKAQLGEVVSEIETILAQMKEVTPEELFALVESIKEELKANLETAYALLVEWKAELIEVGTEYYNALMAQIELQLEVLENEIIPAVVAKIEHQIYVLENEILPVVIAKIEHQIEVVETVIVPELIAKAEAMKQEVCAYIQAEIEKALTFAFEVNAALQAKVEEVKLQILCKLAEIYGIVLDVNATVEEAIAAISNHLAKVSVGDYTTSVDSYYVAIDGAGYAALLAGALNLTDDQFVNMGWDELDFTKLSEADLITVSYNASTLASFTMDQLFAYVKAYLNGFLREDVSAYLNDTFTGILNAENLSTVDALFNGLLDSVLAAEIFAEKELVDLDWAALVGEENLVYIEEAREAIVDAIVKAGIPEVVTIPVDVVATLSGLGVLPFEAEWLYAQLGENAIYTLELPVIDFALTIVESALYEKIRYNANYAETLLTIRQINPEATVVLLGGYEMYDFDIEEIVLKQVISLNEIFMLEEIPALIDAIVAAMPAGADLVAKLGAIAEIEVYEANIPVATLMQLAAKEFGNFVENVETISVAVAEETVELLIACAEYIYETEEEFVAFVSEVYYQLGQVTDINLGFIDIPVTLFAALAQDNIEFVMENIAEVHMALTEETAEVLIAFAEVVFEAEEEFVAFVSEVYSQLDQVTDINFGCIEIPLSLFAALAQDNIEFVMENIAEVHMAITEEVAETIITYAEYIFEAEDEFVAFVSEVYYMLEQATDINLGFIDIPLEAFAALAQDNIDFVMENIAAVHMALTEETVELIVACAEFIFETEEAYNAFVEDVYAQLEDIASIGVYTVEIPVAAILEYLVDSYDSFVELIASLAELDYTVNDIEFSIEIDLSGVYDAIVAHNSVLPTIYATLFENFFVVELPEITTNLEDVIAAYLEDGDVEALIYGILLADDIAAPNAESCEYIVEQILKSLRLTCDHDYTNDCDAICNICGEEREVPGHVYTNDCDADCNVCGETRVPADHVYTNACDADCNVCGETRTPADHVYTNACDTDCNVCGEVRTVSDHVDADKNGLCDICGASVPVNDNPPAPPSGGDNDDDNNNNQGGNSTTDDKKDEGMSTGAKVAIIVSSSVAGVVGVFSLGWFGIAKKSWSDLIAMFRK